MQTIKQRLSSFPQMQAEIILKFLEQFEFDLRCAAPGIITQYDSETQTVEVQIAVKEIIKVYQKNNVYQDALDIPPLYKVPLVMPRAGNFVITFPIKEGDECLLIFSDTYIDSWWQNGCGKNKEGKYTGQVPKSMRRHDLSDAFAILAPWSQPKKLQTLSETDLEIKSIDDKVKIQVKDDAVKISINENTYMEVKDGSIEIISTSSLNVEGSTVNVKGTTVNIAEGVQGVARLGDAVAVTVPEHGVCTGTITSASSKVTAG